MISNLNISNSDLPLVTIVALCYNQARFAEETLDSILAQTYPNIQLIIMDDASTDNSVEVITNWIAKNHVDCTFIAHKENKGICKTLNEALTNAKGTYFQMVACDDIYLPEKTEKQVSSLQTNSIYAMVYTDAYLIKEDSSPHYGWFIQRHRNFSDLPSGNLYDTLLDDNFIPAMSTMIRVEIINDLAGWDENLIYEDYDFWLRLAKNHKIGLLNDPLVKYRLHTTNFHAKIGFEQQKFWIYSKHTDNEKAKRKFQNLFFLLYKQKSLTEEIKMEYIRVFKNQNHTKLIKLNMSYPFFKLFISLLQWKFFSFFKPG